MFQYADNSQQYADGEFDDYYGNGASCFTSADYNNLVQRPASGNQRSYPPAYVTLPTPPRPVLIPLSQEYKPGYRPQREALRRAKSQMSAAINVFSNQDLDYDNDYSLNQTQNQVPRFYDDSQIYYGDYPSLDTYDQMLFPPAGKGQQLGATPPLHNVCIPRTTMDNPYAHPGYPSKWFHPSGSIQPVHREGRLGSSWRHLRECRGNMGNNLMFVEGSVKCRDTDKFPPHGYPYISPKVGPHNPVQAFNLLGASRISLPPPRPQLHPITPHIKAKRGFKYWYNDKPIMKCVPNTIQGRVMKTGVQY